MRDLTDLIEPAAVPEAMPEGETRWRRDATAWTKPSPHAHPGQRVEKSAFPRIRVANQGNSQRAIIADFVRWLIRHRRATNRQPIQAGLTFCEPIGSAAILFRPIRRKLLLISSRQSSHARDTARGHQMGLASELPRSSLERNPFP